MNTDLNKASFSIFSALLLSAFFALLYAPAAALAGAKDGLSVCAAIIVPSLFPFLVLSSMATQLGLPRILARYAAPVMQRVFGLSGMAAAPLLLGFLGGYPVGAAAIAELVKRDELSLNEGERLLPVCNNTGPAFIVGVAGTAIFGSGKIGLGLYLCHIIAALLLAVLFRGKGSETSCAAMDAPIAVPGFAAVLTGAVKGSVLSCLNICGFVVFFSVLRSLLDALGVFQSLTLFLAQSTNSDIGFYRSLLCGIMELGSGISSMRALAATPRNLALCSFILGFGSLSVHCQTLAAISGTKLKCARHFVGRIGHGIISAILTFLLFTLLRI